MILDTDGCNWSQSVTFTAIDSCGNEAEPVTVTVTYKLDDVDPVIDANGAGGDLGCNPTAGEISDALGTATASDNCDASVDVTTTPGDPVNTDGCNWSQSVTFTAIDSCGNEAEPVTVTITYKLDDVDPVIDATGAGGDLGCNPTAGEISDALGTATATDNCDASVDVTTTPGDPVNTDGCNWSQSVTFTATDSCGNEAEPVTITVTYTIDETDPVVTCNVGGDITICDGGSVDLKPSAVDNCDGEVPVTCTRSDGAPNLNDPFEVGVTTVTCEATDECGNTGTCSITVTVLENPVCSITPPAAPPVCGSTGNTISSTTVATSYAWTVTSSDPGNPYGITSGNTSVVTYDAGSGSAIFELVVTNSLNGVECSDSCEITVECTSEGFCTYTQGAYGNSGGTHCDGTTTTPFLLGLLNTNLVVGGGSNRLTLTAADLTSGCFYSRLPGGGPSKKLNGIATCANPVGITLNGTKFKNTLLAQTITMGLNLRISGSTLGSLVLSGAYITTFQNTGTSCDSLGTPIPGTEQTFQLPQSVINYLGANNTVNDLYILANQALAGTYTGTSPNLSQIATALDRLNNAFDGCRMLGGISTVAPSKFSVNDMTSEDNDIFTVSAYPNPFTEKATIDFMLKGAGSNVTVDVYNLTGSKVATLFNGFAEPERKYILEIDGSTLSPGIYIYNLKTGAQSFKDKLILIKQ